MNTDSLKKIANTTKMRYDVYCWFFLVRSGSKGVFQGSTLKKVAGTSECKVAIYLDQCWIKVRNYTLDQILYRIVMQIGRSEYNFFHFNCEAICNVNRYGDEFGYSLQAMTLTTSRLLRLVHIGMARAIKYRVLFQKPGCPVEGIREVIL